MFPDIFQSMKDFNTRPGVVFMLTNVMVMLRLDPSIPLTNRWACFPNIFQNMKDIKVRPGVGLMITNVWVMLRLDPKYSSDCQVEIFLFISEYEGP